MGSVVKRHPVYRQHGNHKAEYIYLRANEKYVNERVSIKAIAVSTDDLIGIVIHIFLHTFGFAKGVMNRDLALVIPAHLILVDAFCPFDLSITASGYSYSVIETAVLWINEYAKVHAPL